MNRTTLQALLLIAAVALAPAATAHDYTVGDLRIEHPWSRATPPGTPVGAGYLAIVNEGERDDRLVGAESPAAGRVQVHRTVEADGTTRMRHQADGVVIPAGGRLELQPGDYHLMLMQLEGALAEGDRVPVTLRFERAGTVRVELAVRPLTGGGEHDH